MAETTDARRRTDPVTAGLLATSAAFHYLGPAFAVLLFARVDVLGVAWLRIASAAVVLGVWRRPWQLGLSWLLVGWGTTLAVMNACFYLALDRLPLATVAAIEFAGVVAVATVGVRTPRNGLALALTAGGALVVTGVVLAGQALGLVFAIANAGLFALYVVLGHRAARTAGGIDALAGAMVVATVPATALGGVAVLPSLDDPVALAAGVGVGVCSSVIPYATDQLAMQRVPRATYALMTALLPATAAVIGAIVLGQVPGLRTLLGIALVVGGVALHRPADVD